MEDNLPSQVEGKGEKKTKEKKEEHQQVCHYCEKYFKPEVVLTSVIKHGDESEIVHFCSFECFEKQEKWPRSKRKKKGKKGKKKK